MGRGASTPGRRARPPGWPSCLKSETAYAMVGMGGAVAALTRGPLTGLMMVYELSGNYAIILPLMVTCTLASALCHTLVERRAGVEPHTLRRAPVKGLVVGARGLRDGDSAVGVTRRTMLPARGTDTSS